MLSDQFLSELADAVTNKVVAQLAAKGGPLRRLLTVAEAAEYFGRTKQQRTTCLLQARSQRSAKGPASFIDRLALDAWLDELED